MEHSMHFHHSNFQLVCQSSRTISLLKPNFGYQVLGIINAMSLIPSYTLPGTVLNHKIPIGTKQSPARQSISKIDVATIPLKNDNSIVNPGLT